MFFNLHFTIFLSAFILITSCISDLKFRKIFNIFLLFWLVISLIFLFILGGLQAIKVGSLSAGLALLIGIPLGLFRVIGGGDLKLLVVLAFSLHWSDFLQVFMYSIFWAALLGLLMVALQGQLKKFFKNILALFRKTKAKDLKFHTMPYSAALFMAWLSVMSLKNFVVVT